MNPTEKPALLLLADDDSDDRLLVKDALDECQWRGELRCVENGEELLDYLLRRGTYNGVDPPRPGLILLDLNMPRKDGRQALRRNQSRPRSAADPGGHSHDLEGGHRYRRLV